MRTTTGSTLAAFIRQELARRLPEQVRVESDEPARSDGIHLVDVFDGDWSATVSITAEGRIGLAAGPAEEVVLGELADERIADWTLVAGRVLELHRARGSTAADPDRLLLSLRHVRGLEQRTLAGRLGVSQPAVSVQERRRKVLLSTLVRYARAMECRLTVAIDHPGGRLEFRDGQGEVRRGRRETALVRALEASNHDAPEVVPTGRYATQPAQLRRLEVLAVIRDDGVEEDAVEVHDECPSVGRTPLDGGTRPAELARVAVCALELGA